MVQSRIDFSFVFEALREKEFLSIPAEFAAIWGFRVEVKATCVDVDSTSDRKRKGALFELNDRHHNIVTLEPFYDL